METLDDALPATLTAADRCDRSPSEQAFIMLESPESGNRIQLCAHHYKLAAESLISWFIVVDDRPRMFGVDE